MWGANVGCSCKHNKEQIEFAKREIATLRDLFLHRMTMDSDTNDRRRKEFNQAIFRIYSAEEVDEWNRECEKYGLGKRGYGDSYPVWSEVNLNMVLKCFDDAVKDYRRTWCDVDSCKRK